MAVAFETITNTTYGSRANTTVTVPAGVASGDLLLAFIAIGAATNPANLTTPAGWTIAPGTWPREINVASTFYVDCYAYYRIASGSEPADYTWTHATFSSQGVMLRYSGVDSTTPFDVTPTINSGTGATVTWTSITPVTNGSMIVATEWDFADNTTNCVVPTGTTPTFTERLDVTLTYVCDGVLATAGATGAKTHTSNSTGVAPWASTLIALRPGSGAVNVTLTPGAQTAVGATLTPTVTTGSNVNLAPSAATALGATRAPVPAVTAFPAAATATAGMATLVPVATFTADIVSATAGTLAPTVTTGSNVTLTPPAQAAVATTRAPIVSVGTGVSLAPAAASATGGTLAPGVALSLTRVLTAATATGGTLTPTVQTAGNVSLSPTAVSSTAGTLAPSVSLGYSRTFAAVTATAGTLAPTVDTAGNALIVPAAAVAAAGSSAPVVQRGSVFSLAAATATAATRVPATAGPVIVYIGRAERALTRSGRIG